MARFDKHGGRVPTNLFECAAWHVYIQVICCRPKCRRIAIFNPHQLWWRFERKGWPDDLHRVRDKMRCTACGASGSVSTLRGAVKATVTLPWPDEREWKRALTRFRA